jgi:hypothetical protein
MAAVMMSVLKKGSRNASGNGKGTGESETDYEKIFGIRLPHTDTVDEIMRKTDENCLKKLKTEPVKILIKKKVFHRSRVSGKYLPAVDGSHAMTVSEGHCEHCLKRTSGKSGKTTYFHNVAEAEPVTENGFSISSATERVENPEGKYDKQDCGLKASVRLAEKLKKDFPRLPICICGDGLYPDQTFSGICEENERDFILSSGDGNLPPVWEEIRILKELSEENRRRITICKGEKKTVRTYKWVNDIDYKGFMPNRSECAEESDDKLTRFVFISSFGADYFRVTEITGAGRMRRKTENEGSDIRKNHGYGPGHQYSGVSLTATKNYCQCMRIAHIINQLSESGSLFMPILTGKMTVKHLRECMPGELIPIRYQRLILAQ